MHLQQIRKSGGDFAWGFDASAENGADYGTSHDSPSASTHSRRPSLRTTIVPSTSVRNTCAPCAASDRSTPALGCPYMFPAPTEMSAIFGCTASRNSFVLL